ncbi:PAS domain S-box protein [Amaricoccus solimangrovi]|uniref:histidine kinase n=1 Tax=Amaricoccus solimangrovi TaxID=2589815 RepID=A0A501WS27_9RHOB|nr:PAS domain S-box protein [Amaricoccus solimangrovi]TPE51642.1 PAS domain S-box protein [Amaricoccus solimangrovi]
MRDEGHEGWLGGGGDTGARVRARDWASTSLGPITCWPASLRTALTLVLDHPLPMALAWGPELVTFPNDACAALPGGPGDVLGRPFPEGWGAARRGLASRIAGALDGAAARFDGASAGLAFDHCLSPVRDATGAVVGIIDTLTPALAPERARFVPPGAGEERETFLLRLSDALRPLTEAVEVLDVAMRLLAGQLDVMGATCLEIDADEDGFALIASHERSPARASAPTRLSAFAPDMAEAYRAGSTLSCRDTELEPERDAYRAVGIRAWVGVPLVKQGRLLAIVGVHSREPRDWTREEVRLLEDVAERAWAAVERARAEAALAASEGRYRSFFETMRQGYDECEMIRDATGRPVDYRVLDVNPAFERLLGMTAGELRGRRASEVMPDFEEWWPAEIDRILATGAPGRVGREVPAFDRFYEVTIYPRGGDRFAAVCDDITERRRVELVRRENEARQVFLLRLSDALRPLGDPGEIQETACRIMAEQVGAEWVGCAEACGGDQTIGRQFPAAGPGATGGWFGRDPFRSADRDAGDTGSGIAPAHSTSDGRSFVAVPLVKAEDLVVVFGARRARPSGWTPAEVSLIEEAADRAWAAVERARAEVARRASEERYRTLFESIDQGFCVIEVLFDEAGAPVDYLFLEANPAFESKTGLVEAEGKRMRALAPGHEQFWFDTYGRVARTGHPERFQHRAEALGRWYDVYALRLGPAEENRVAILFDDITERRRAETALRESEERQAFLLKLSDTLRPIADPVEIQARAMRVLGEHLGVTRAQYYEADPSATYLDSQGGYADGAPPVVGRFRIDDFGQHVTEAYRAGRTLAVGDVTAEARFGAEELGAYAALGIGAYLGVPVMKAGRLAGIVGLHQAAKRDWTPAEVALVEETADRTWAAVERARTEAALRESEERFRQFGEASRDVLWIRDAETLQWQYLTPAFEEIYGLSREEALANDNYRSWMDLIVPEDRARAADSVRSIRRGAHVTFDYRIRRPSDRAIRWLRNTDFPIADASGQVIMVGGIGHDLTELRETELRLQTLIEGMPQLVWRAVGGGTWTWASPQWFEYTGQSAAESLGWGWLEALYPPDRETAREAWAHALETGGFEVEYRLRRGEGFRWFKTRATAVRDGTGAIIEWLGTSTDIHELRELQERQRILVAELQHRTRNLMAVVRSMADRTGDGSQDLDDFLQRFRARLEALARVQGLLSRLGETDRVAFDELLGTEIEAMPGAGGQVILEGPRGIRLRSSMAQMLAMALHELATNAMKYGALSQPRAVLAVRWSARRSDGENRPWLDIEWRESGVRMPPADRVLAETGQGRELIERALPYQFGAKTTFALEEDGVHCTISIPVSASGESAAGSAA